MTLKMGEIFKSFRKIQFYVVNAINLKVDNMTFQIRTSDIGKKNCHIVETISVMKTQLITLNFWTNSSLTYGFRIDYILSKLCVL